MAGQDKINIANQVDSLQFGVEKRLESALVLYYQRERNVDNHSAPCDRELSEITGWTASSYLGRIFLSGAMHWLNHVLRKADMQTDQGLCTELFCMSESG